MKDTQPRGAGVIQIYNDKTYMLYNTAGEASGKWFVYASEGARFEHPGKIPEGIKEGFDFIIKRFPGPGREIKIKRRYYENSVTIFVIYGNLNVNDFSVRENKFIKNLSHYEEIKSFSSLDLCDHIGCTISIKKGDEYYNKYSNELQEININDILNDLNGNWKYIGGIGEIIFW